MIKDSKINPVSIMTNHIQANSNSSRSPISTNHNPHPLRSALRRFAATAALLLGIALPTSAADYVIAYTSGNKTYYVGMNSSNQLIATTNFDMSCIWTCINNNNNTENTLATNNRRRLRNKKNTSYYLNASVTRSGNYYSGYTYTWNISASTTSSNYWYGSNGSSLYHSDNSYSQGNGYLHSSGSSITISTSNSNAFIPYQVSTANASATTQRAITNLTITPSASTISYNSSQEFNASATSSTRSIPAHTTYTFNGITYYYYNNTFYPSTEDFCSYSSASFTIDYTWSKSGDGSSNLALSTTSGNRTTATNSNSGSQDQTVTLTVTASATNATSTTFSTSITLWSATQTPTITRSDNYIYLSSTSNGATIYYTTNGNNPTASSNVYSGPFSIEQLNHPVTIKAIAIRGGSTSGIASQEYTKPKCATPVITISSSGNVDITCSTTDAQIRYTTDGTNPDGSSSLYNVSLVVSNLQTVKAIAIKTNYDNSELASEQYVTTGTTTSGEIVLDDREDHTWAYYSDENNPIHCLKPADIKITYSGYGTKTMTDTNTDQLPANSAFTKDVTSGQVQVNKNESGNIFIYFKTLENAKEDGSGNYPYTMIPNPFQVRPTSGSGNARWRGFYAWRVRSLSDGLSIKVGSTTYNSSNISSGIIIYAEQEVEFITSNPKGNTVEFEALWAKAYLDDGTNHYSNSGNYRNAYERNFKKVTSLSTYNYPVTISSINPDGSGTVGTVSGPYRNNYTCSQDVKLENMTLGMGNYYIDGNSYNLTIGRGVANGNNDVASAVYGDYSGSSVRSNFTLRIEGGRYSNVRVFYNGSRTNCSDAFTGHVYFGSDYDRANNETNNKLVVSSRVGLSQELAFTNAASITEVFVMSGTFGTNTADVEFYMGYQNATSGASQAKRSIRIYGGDFLGGLAGGIEGGELDANTVYLTMRISGGTIHRYLYGSGQFSPAYGTRQIVITGGTFDSWVSGGCYGTNNEEGNTEGNTYLYFGGYANQTNTEGIFGAGYGNYATGNDKYTVHNSTVVFADEANTAGSVYGGGNNGYAKDDINVYIAGGTISGNVFGGANKAPSKADIAVTVTNGTVNGGVYGGSNQSGDISGNITVDVYGTDPAPSANAYAIGAVFGGGNQAAYNGKPVVTVHGCDNSIEYVYGGGNAATVTGTDVTIYGGNKIGNVFGGCYGANVTSNGTNVKIYGGTIGKVFGGSNSSGTITGTINVKINKQKETGAANACPMIIGEVYSGGNVAGSAAGNIEIGCTGDLTDAHIAYPENIGATLEGIGYVYGGANQANIGTAQNKSNISLKIESGMIANVYGGNNQTGTVNGTITVNIERDETKGCGWYVGNVFGGGNLADYSGNPKVYIKNGTVSGNVYGGGNGDPADGTQVKGSTAAPTVIIGDVSANHSSYKAVVLGDVYGGGNAAKITGSAAPQVQILNKANTEVGNVYGGGNAADVPATDVIIHAGTIHGDVFGGGHGDKVTLNDLPGESGHSDKVANVNGNTSVKIYGGVIDRVFAGSNLNGTITGTACTLYVAKSDTTKSPMKIREVYGGGNMADGNATSISIGCTGPSTEKHSNPAFIDSIGVTLEGIGTVYGGANQAGITSPITVSINSGMIANVFGGNNTSGNITGKITVNIQKSNESCGWYLGNVYGGGNQAAYKPTQAGDYPEVNIKNGTVSGNVFGGGLGSTAKVYSNPKVTIGDPSNNSYEAIVSGNVYGGGSAAMVGDTEQATASTNYTTVLIRKGNTSVGKVFGGGMAAAVTGTTSVTLDAGTVTSGVYGGCDSDGSVGAVTVALTGGTVGASNNPANVFGGGLGASTSTTGNISVTLTGTTVYGDIYGGSALGSVNASTSNTTTININGTNKLNGTIYGGGMGDNNTTPDSTTAVSNGNVIINYAAANTGLKKGIYGGANINGNVKGKITLNINANVGALGDNNSRNIFGGGLGAATSTEGSITVNIGNASSTPTIYGDVYGGSALGSVNKLTTDVDSINFNKGTINGFIFGGGQGDNSTKAITNGKTIVNINTNASNNIKGIYGGANINGNVKGDIVVNVYANVGATDSGNSRDIFGGGLGQNTDTEGNVTVNIGTLAYDANKTPTIYGDIYGGSAKGNVNKLSTQSVTYYTRVNFQNGTLHGNIYGGGLGQKADDSNSAILAKVNGWVEVNIGSNSQSSNDCKIDLRDAKIFGGNNTNGSPQDSVAVRIYNTAHNYSDYSSGDRYKASYKPAANETEYYAIKEVFGGGNEADYTPVITNASYIRRTGVYVIGCDNTIKRVFSGGNAAAATGVATHIDGGRFDYIYGGGNGEDKAANIGSGGTNLNVHGGIVNCLFGGSNHSGIISGPMRVNVDGAGSCSQNMYIAEFFCGNNEAPVNTNINAIIGCGTKFGDVYGGCNKASIDGDVILTIKGGEMNNVYGGSKGTQSDSANIKGNVTLNVYGGIIKKKAFGGSNINGNITGKITVNLDWSQADVCDPAITLRVDSIFGGSNLAEYTPGTKGSYPEVNIKHGTVGYVFGGGKGATAIVHSNPVVTIGDSNTEHYAIVNYNVYGGGDAAAVDGYTVVTYDDEHANSHVGNLFGGGNAASVSGTATVTLTNGKVTSGIYGGCNASGSIGGKVTLNLNYGSVGTSSNLAGVYGGGLGAATRVNGDIEVNIAGSTIYGDVYGGSAKGVTNCNDAGTAHNGTSKTDVNLSAGTVYGSIYGGGHGIDNEAANVWGPVMVTVNGGSVQKLNGSTNPASIFGCNNLNGSPKDSVVVKILTTNATVTNNGVKTYAINGVYGGGNEAHYDPTTTNVNYPKVTVECGTSIKYVFGGGNAAAVPNTNVIIYGGDIDSLFAGGNGTSGPAHVGYKNKDNSPTTGYYGGGNTSATIYGGNIRHIFGGSNANGVIRTNGPLVINKTGSCDMIIGEVYGGGNQADGNASQISILNTGTLVTGADGHAAHPENIGVTLEGIGTVYGGANAADIGTRTDSSNITLNINSGMIANVFGGNNTTGTIYGTVLVNINQNQSSNWYVGNVFGGGNLADYSGATTVNITNGEVSQNVYGGGNEAGVGSATVNMNGGTVKKAVYGGCNTSGTVTGDIAVNFTSGTIGTNTSNSQHIYGIFGGGYGSSTVTEGDVIVTIGNGTSAPVVYGDVYGGSALGIVNDSTAQTPQTTKVWLKSGTVNGYVYGGGLGDNAHPALVFGDVQVVVDGGSVTEKIFGCNNVNGTPRGSVQVDINSTNSTQINNGVKTYALKGVYGGGNLANYVPTTANSEYPKVTVACGTSVKEVFGGGNAASVPNTNVIINGGDIDLVFAGGNGTDGAAHVGYNSKADNPAATTSYGDGNTSAVIHGGTINKIFGGSNANGIIRTTGTLEINKNADCAMYIGQVYGGGNEADGNASAISILNTGTLVTGDNGHAANPDAIGITLEGIQTVFGGANNANVGSSASNNAALSLTISSGMVANVFGGNNTNGEIYGTVEVNIDKDPNRTNWYVGNVFGAGKDADYTGSPNTYIKNGTVSGNVYGGGQGVGAVVKGNPKVEMTGGTVNGNIFGGGDAADVTGIVTVNIKGGTVFNDVYGGGALANTNIGNATNYGQANESVTSTTTNYTTVNLTGGTVKNVYGGGLGDADTEAKVYGNVFVNLNKGVSTDSKGAVITDYLFGCNNINGTPLGSVTVFVQGTQNSGLGTMLAKNNDSYDMKAIYGGGNLAAYIPKADTASTHVIINACRTASIEYVYGGGNAAPVPATDVKIYGSYKIGSLFGGGNGLDSIYVNGVKEENPGADVGIHKVSLSVFNDTDEDLQYKDPGHEKGNDKYILYGDTTGTSIIGTTHVTFYGGIVGHLFGGSNTKGDIIKKSNVILGDEDLLTCDFSVEDVYGGSNEAYMSGSAAIEMNCVDGMEQIYGGSRMADVNDDIVLTITGGKYGKVFGGNNISGRIFGSITVNIVQTGCLPIVIGELYGGGNQAPYSVYGYNGNSLLTPEDGGSQLYDDPIINIISCDSIGKVFGGGLGATAKMIGNPHVNINMIKGWTNGDYRGNGKQKDPHDKYKLNPRASETIGVIDTVFGGGNEAIVQGQTYINIGTDSIVTIKQVSNAIYKVIKNSVSVHGTPFASNDGDAVTKDLTISIEGANITGNVYGGGNNANVTGGTNIVVGREGQQQQQQQQQQPAPNPAPASPQQQTEPQAQPAAPQTNAATESQQTRTANPTRL